MLQSKSNYLNSTKEKKERFESKTQINIWNRKYIRDICPNFFSYDSRYK